MGKLNEGVEDAAGAENEKEGVELKGDGDDVWPNGADDAGAKALV